jgi:eight-cysteine-cluster-containing protein
VKVEPVRPISTPAEGQDPGLVRASGGDPQSLYQSCLSRVEGRGKPGECSTDADCTKAGCSQEMCIARAEAAGVMSTCEVRPCFAVLDSCGCQAGQCTWSLKSEAPVIPNSRTIELPQ